LTAALSTHAKELGKLHNQIHTLQTAHEKELKVSERAKTKLTVRLEELRSVYEARMREVGNARELAKALMVAVGEGGGGGSGAWGMGLGMGYAAITAPPPTL